MKFIENYADLLVRTGVNIRPGQTLVINSQLHTAEFARLCAVKAYEAGAKEVVMNWNDEKSGRIFYDMASDEVFDEVKAWKVAFNNHYAEIDAAFLTILSDDPNIFEGVEPSKMSRMNKAYAEHLKPYRSKLMSNKVAWCLGSVPSESWAKKVFPELEVDKAMEALWDAIFKATRADLEDPVKAWEAHDGNLREKLNRLNDIRFEKLVYKNSIGTNVEVKLPETHLWYGGADTHVVKNYRFVANMPTEEVYTLPKRDGVNGKIVSSYPLVYNGVLIKDFWFEFKDGMVVDFGANENQNMLDEILAMDEGAKRLGEVALVPYDSPISNLGLLFYETLFDENASCHFALGEAYPICIEGGEDMSEEELIEKGANVSDTHIDFMVGTEDLDIVGITKDGKEVQVFKNGNFAF